jgi:protein-tyrosine phosphatase
MARMMFVNFLNERKERAEWDVDSSALSSWELGNGLWAPARETLKEHHIPVLKHTAKKLKKNDLEHFDLIAVMTYEHLQLVQRIFGESDNVYMYRQFRSTPSELLVDPAAPELDISDPWYGPDSGFEETYRQLENGLELIYNSIRLLHD